MRNAYSCYNADGSQKMNYGGLSRARKIARIRQKDSLAHLVAYRCNENHFHIGRTNKTHETVVWRKNNDKLNERLAGQFVSLLRPKVRV